MEKRNLLGKGIILYALLFVNTCLLAQTLSVSSSSLQLSAAVGSSASLTVTSSSYWAIYNVSGWLTLDTIWAKGNYTVRLTAEQNPFTSTRIDTIHVGLYDTSWSYVSEAKVIVTQSASSYGISDSVLQIGASSGSTRTFTVTADAYWEIADLPSWLTVDKNWKSSTTTVTLTATENPQSTVRTGTFTVNRLLPDSTYLACEVTVKQTASQYGVSSEKVEIDAAGGSTASFWVTSNTSWTVSGAKSWLTVNKTSSSVIDTVELTALENTESYYKADTLTVTFSGGKTYQVLVIQEPADASLSISPSSLAFGTGNTVTVSVTSNTNWGLINIPSWLSPSQVIGYGDSTVIFTAASTTASRSDSLVAYWFDADNVYHSVYVKVSQTPQGTVSIAPFNEKETMPVVLPNPVKDSFAVSNITGSIKTISILSMDGKPAKLVSKDFDSVDVSSLPKGTYKVVIITDNGKKYINTIIKL